ncbi:MAG: hypothetical protein Q7R84_00330 [bacterium]|nr:hypothetical protein [bacterium]
MIFWSRSAVYCLKKVRRTYLRHAELQWDDVLVLTKIGNRWDKDRTPLPPSENRKELVERKDNEAHEAELCGDGTLRFGIIDFSETGTSESWITIECDPVSIFARFLSETSVCELKIIKGKIRMKKVARFSAGAPIGKIMKGDKVYFSVYGGGNITLYNNGERVESFYSTSFREFP